MPGYYDFVRSDIAPLLPPSARLILDVGCGSGATSAWLKSRFPHARTVGLEGNAALRDALARNVDEAHIVDLNGPIPEIGRPDLVLFLDILEHLPRPEHPLAQVIRVMADDATVIISLPNVAHVSVAWPLFFRGVFQYQDAGILDRTHMRFFYRDSALALIQDAGLQPIGIVRNGLEGRRSALVNRLTFGILRDRLTIQYVISATKLRRSVSRVA